MRHLLILCMTMAVLLGSGCSDNDSSNFQKKDQLIDVVICVFNNYDMDNSYKIVAMLPDGSAKKIIYNTLPCSSEMTPVIGCDGRTLLFREECYNDGLYSFDIPSKRVKELYKPDNSYYYNPMWYAIFSPDMKDIYALNDHGSISVYTISTGMLTNIHYNEGMSGPSITADGKHLVFAGHERRFSEETGRTEDFSGIFTIDPDQRNLKMVKQFDPIEGKDVNFERGAISVIPATSEIIYALQTWSDDVCYLYKTSLDGTGQTLLLSTEGYIDNLSSNRKGNLIMYFMDNEIHVGNLQDNTITNTTTIDMGQNSDIINPRFTVIKKSIFNSLPDLVIPTSDLKY